MVNIVDLPQPPVGNKIFCAQDHGIYVLESGPATFRAMANTHQGNGSISVVDGVVTPGGQVQGRLLFNANPPILGMWMFDGGCHNGLVLVLEGSAVMSGLSPCVTITWMPAKTVKRQISEV